MSANWSQGVQHSNPMQNNQGHYQSSRPKHTGPAPSCFHCGGEHFLVNCPEKQGSTPVGQPAPVQNFPNGGPAQWGNAQNGSAVARSTPRAPVVSRFPLPDQLSQYGNAAGSYGSPVAAAPFQQYPGSAPPVQTYPPPQGSYPPNQQQYGPSGAPYGYTQPPPYNAAPSYGNPAYQPPPQNQYPPPSQQYGAPPFQNASQTYGPSPTAAPYRVPTPSYPPQNSTYASPTPPPQWSNTLPRGANGVPPYQQPNNSSFNPGYHTAQSGAPRRLSQQQQTPLNQKVEIQQPGHQTPASSSISNQPPLTQVNQNLPGDKSGFPEKANESKAESHSSSRRGSTSKDEAKVLEDSDSTSVKVAEEVENVADEASAHEEGELTVKDLEHIEFTWELEKVFQEQPPTENVALAQPLSFTFESTPVPLLDHRLNNSVSRYARKENLKEFTKPIRSQPQWSYLKEDPAFSDAKMDGALIPINEVPAWMAARHGEEVRDLQVSKKRARSEEDEQEDVDNQIKLEASSEHPTGDSPNKRQKNEEVVDEDTIIVQTCATPNGAPGTPTLGRAGTPSFGGEDDVWAPQPGEGAASAPLDPTEALLASLGVSGSPKPVQEGSRGGSVAELSNPEQDTSTPPFGNLPQSMSPQVGQPGFPYTAPPQTNSSQGMSPQSQFANGMPQQHNPSQMRGPYNNPRQNSHGASMSPHGAPYNHPPSRHNSYGNAMSPQNSVPPFANHPPQPNAYGNGMPPQGNAPFNNQPSRHNSFGNGIPPQGNATYVHPPRHNSFGNPNQSFGPPRQNSFSNGIPPQNGPPYINSPQGMGPQGYPPENQYGNGMSPYGSAPYGIAPQGTPQYNAPYGMPPQPYPPPNNYGPGMPPQGNAPYGGPPQENPQYGSGPYPYGGPPGNPVYGNPQNSISPQGNPSYQQFPPQGNQPPRQDSGYGSLRGSYSNGSSVNNPGMNGSNHGLPLAQSQKTSQAPVDGGGDTPPAKKARIKAEPALKVETTQLESKSSPENSQGESPLSPTELELLGNYPKLVPGKKTEATTARKVKRPAPIVDEAFSRRW